MTIEVNNKPTAGHTSGSQETLVRRDTAAPKEQAKPTPATGDTVTVTDTASRLHRLERALSSQPVVDLQRVQAIRKDLARGAYEPDPARVAEKMFLFERARSA